MFNNFDNEQEHFSYLTPEELNPLSTGGAPIAQGGPMPTPRVAEDMFATVDKSGVNANANANLNPTTFTRPSFNPTQGVPMSPNQVPNNPLASTSMPRPGGGSFKYLIIGIFTLLVVLGGGYAAYEFILKPQFQAVQAPTTETIVQEPQIVPETPAVTAPTETVSTETTTTTEIPAIGEITTGTVAQNPELMTPTVIANTGLDSDGDGLTDAEEVQLTTDPLKADTDGDGLTDREEVKIYLTDPKNSDTDGDGYLDGAEVKAGYNPKGPGRLLIVK